MTYPIKGSCQCGQLTYILYKAPLKVFACHCQECQKLSSSPFSVTAVVAADTIEFHGQLKQWVRIADSGNKNIAHFCPDCGNRIYHLNPADPSSIKLKLKPTNLVDDAIFEPSLHVWTSEKLSWYGLPEGVKSVEKQP